MISKEPALSQGFTVKEESATVNKDAHCPGGRLPRPPLHNVDPLTQRAFEAFGRVLHLHRQAMLRGLRRSGLHHGAVIALRLLALSDGMSQRDLAEVLHLSRPRTTGILQSLEKAGAVRRVADPDDQRITRVFLTAEGRRLEEAHRAAFEDYVNSTVGALNAEEKQQLAHLLELLAAQIEERLRSQSGFDSAADSGAGH